MPGSISIFDSPAKASLVAFLPDGRAPCRRALSPDYGRGGISIPLDRQFSDHAAQDFTQSFGSVAPSIFEFIHAHSMERTHDRVVASAYVKARS